MRELSVIIRHSLGIKEAVKRLNEKIEELKSEYEGKFALYSTWEDNCLRFRLKAAGMKTQGYMKVSDSAVTLSGKLPLTLAAFGGKIESTLRAELLKILCDGD
ncbi:MAG: polyhydroxyalkanoic acid system family protein [Kosmotogaceae bacterium]|nr:polyhydroxyalkanoic acid system family protein [Kosmotogaceae bacterium]